MSARPDDLPDLLREVTAVARAHVRREKEAAFPLADDLLGPGLLRALGAHWSVRQDVRLRGGSHER